jgi:hypothetical protein
MSHYGFVSEQLLTGEVLPRRRDRERGGGWILRRGKRTDRTRSLPTERVR